MNVKKDGEKCLADGQIRGAEGTNPEYFQDGKELAGFLERAFPMTEGEGDRLLGYMEGHGFLLGHINGELYRADLCYEWERVHWEPYSIDDAVCAITEWNHGLLEDESAENPTDEDNYLDTLQEDGKILDGMLCRIRHGK